MLLKKIHLSDENTPLSLRDISPEGAKILILLVELSLPAEFSPPLGGVAEGRGGVSDRQGFPPSGECPKGEGVFVKKKAPDKIQGF
jgi:hypothetical protein